MPEHPETLRTAVSRPSSLLLCFSLHLHLHTLINTTATKKMTASTSKANGNPNAATLRQLSIKTGVVRRSVPSPLRYFLTAYEVD